ncbi:MAG: hypothetical protein O7G87_05865 [bacterium]|nr:hypothetical protein [bacterium]
MPKKPRPCPRGLYDGCPIPRELCSKDYERTKKWHCMKFLKEFEWFVFGTDEEDKATEAPGMFAEDDIVSMEDLMRVLAEMDEDV